MMGAISEKLTYLSDTKKAIKNAIVSKGVEVSDSDSFRSYADKIVAIEQPAGGSSDVEDAILTRSITEYVNSRITSVGNNALMGSASLKTIYLPNVKTAGNSSFNACSSLVDVNIPKLETISTQTFYGCSSLMYLTLPSLKTAAVQSFRNCKKLTVVDLASCTSISNLAFDTNPSFKCLVLRATSVCSLANTAAMSNTPIASGTGYVYVPSALVDSYKSATNWTTYAEQIRALENYTIDGTTTGEIDMTKI